MTRDDVIDVLTVVAAATHRTVGEADVDIWEAVMGHCDKQLALRAVRDHLRNQPGVWLEPGHIVALVRGYMLDQRQRETDAERQNREDEQDRRLRLDHAFRVIPAADEPRRPITYGDSPLIVKCPWCGAQPATRCHMPGTRHALTESSAHPSRIEAAEKFRADLPARQRAAAPPAAMEER